MFDFPASPPVGTIATTPDGTSRSWDGVKWIGAPGVGGPAVPGPYLPLAGGTMSGPLNVTATGSTAPRPVQDRWADAVSVLDFGATGNGTTDDTTAINAALIYAATVAKAVFLPPGTYRVGLSLNYPSGLAGIIGAGQKATTLKRIDGDSARHYIIWNSAAVDGLRIRDMTLDGNKANNTQDGAGIVIVSGSRIHIENVTIANVNSSGGVGGAYGWGVYLGSNNDGANGTQSVLRNVSVIACEGIGVSLNPPITDLDVEGCLFQGNGGAGLVGTSGTIAGGLARITVRGCSAIGNLKAGMGLGGILSGYNIAGAQDCVFSGNKIYNNAQYGLSWQGINGVVTGNIVRGNGNYTPIPFAGILFNAARSVLSDNNIAYNRVWGVDAGGSQYCVVSNNIMEHNYNDNPSLASGTGMNLGAGVGNLVEGNHFLQNGEAPGNPGGCCGVSLHPYDGGGAYPAFPVEGGSTSILNNLITASSSSTAFGISFFENSVGNVIQGNTLKGFSSSWRGIYVGSQGTTVSGNRSLDAPAGESIAAAATLVCPDYAETLLLTGAAANIATIITRAMSDAIGKVVAIHSDVPGSGFASTPTVTISGDGTGATATAYLNGADGIGGYHMISGGSGYTTATVSWTGGGGSGQAATARVGYPNSTDGRILRLVNNSGNNQTLVNGTLLRLGGANIVLAPNAAITLIGGTAGWTPA